MKRFFSYFLIFIASLAALFFVGCPSPAGISGLGGTYSSTARVVDDGDGLVFVEEDGTEIPIVADIDGESDGPVELIDFAVLDDGEGRFADSDQAPRCIVVGRRSDGRSGVWVVFRGLGVHVIPNEDGIEDSALMELVELQGTPWLDEDWTYEATAVSDDGKVIVGTLSRPEGWEYIEDDVPDPSIGVWWNIYETDEFLKISRARPIILMEEPEDADASARCAQGDPGEWLEELIEWLQVFILNQAWNYLATADGFVDQDTLDELGITVADGLYPVTGIDKYGADAWAWITASSVEDIEDAQVVDDPEENLPPWPVAGPTLPQDMPTFEEPFDSFFLVIEDGEGNAITDPLMFDPNGTGVTFTAELITSGIYAYTGPSGPNGELPSAVVSPEGLFTVSWLDDHIGNFVYFNVVASDGVLESEPTVIGISIWGSPPQ